jgi:hypothetical protein
MQAISKNMENKVLAFFCGDLLVTLYIHLAGIIGNLGDFALKVLVTLIIGAVGGLAGMVGKDVYPVIKKYFKRKPTKDE